MLNPGPGAPVTINADRASVGPNVEETTPVTLEGHVRIKASASAVHGSSSEQGMASELGNVLIEADRIVMTKQADGRELLEIENGSIRQL